MSDSRIYEAAPLARPSSQIRLLRCVSRPEDLTLLYEFFVCDLADPPEYEAISYTWGDSERQDIIWANKLPASVTTNARYALWQARQYGSVYTWIDCICINQQDLTEKNGQVAIMWDIYHRASMVLACIGPPDVASDNVFAALLDIEHTVASFHQNHVDYPLIHTEGPGCDALPQLLRSMSSIPGHQGLTQGEPLHDVLLRLSWERLEGAGHGHCVHFDGIAWMLDKGMDRCVDLCEDYIELCQRPYFSRLWVAQELHAGGPRTRIMFGTKPVNLDGLRQLDEAIHFAFRDRSLHQKSSAESARRIYTRNPLFQAYSPDQFEITYSRPCLFRADTEPPLQILRLTGLIKGHLGFLQHLEWTSGLLCRDDRDHIWGTLHFFQWERDNVPPLQPDYTKGKIDIALSLISSRIPQLGTGSVCLTELINLVRALKITLHEPELVHLLSSDTKDWPRRRSESLVWDVPLEYQLRLNRVRTFHSNRHPRAINLEVLPSSGSWDGSSITAAECPLASAELQDQCKDIIKREAVSLGHGWREVDSKFLDDAPHPWEGHIVPTSAAIGDEIFTVPFRRLCRGLVVRRNAVTEEVSIIGQASLQKTYEDIHRHLERPRLWQRSAIVRMRATIEEMICFLVGIDPDDSDTGVEPLAFRIPEVISLTSSTEWFSALSNNGEYKDYEAVDFVPAVPLRNMDVFDRHVPSIDEEHWDACRICTKWSSDQADESDPNEAALWLREESTKLPGEVVVKTVYLGDRELGCSYNEPVECW